MTKAKKAHAEKRQKRQKTDWGLFLQLCKQGKSNEHIADKLGWKVDAKSADPFKRVRAAKSLARTKGIRVNGKTIFLRDAKLKGAEKAKTRKAKKATAKPNPKQKTENHNPLLRHRPKQARGE